MPHETPGWLWRTSGELSLINQKKTSRGSGVKVEAGDREEDLEKNTGSCVSSYFRTRVRYHKDTFMIYKFCAKVKIYVPIIFAHELKQPKSLISTWERTSSYIENSQALISFFWPINLVWAACKKQNEVCVRFAVSGQCGVKNEKTHKVTTIYVPMYLMTGIILVQFSVWLKGYVKNTNIKLCSQADSYHERHELHKKNTRNLQQNSDLWISSSRPKVRLGLQLESLYARLHAVIIQQENTTYPGMSVNEMNTAQLGDNCFYIQLNDPEWFSNDTTNGTNEKTRPGTSLFASSGSNSLMFGIILVVWLMTKLWPVLAIKHDLVQLLLRLLFFVRSFLCLGKSSNRLLRNLF